MIRVLTPVGKLVYVDQIQPVCEKQVMFNGRRIVMMERARDLSVKPTALAMNIAEVGMRTPWLDELQIGNLKPEKVIEIIRVLGEKEYYDFSTLPYQSAEKYDQVVLDNGESAAYSSCIQGLGMMGTFCDGNPENVEFPMGTPQEYIITENSSSNDGLNWD